jgi:geranylgeranyl diphosphate synthase type II
MAAEACGCDRSRALPAACAVEMVHTYSLIHDDLPAMDDDDLRRGQPSCHVQHGEDLAILAGDALLTQAFEILAGEIEPAQTAARCCRELARAAGALAMVGGQVDDLDRSFVGGNLERLEQIHRRKTGAMIQISLTLGGIVAGANSVQGAAFTEYGEKLGLAFQIIDDLLDIEGSRELLGKTVGKDAEQGKPTFPALLGIAASRERAERLIRESQQALMPLGERADCLASLAQYVLERKR